jgi:signal transduction histidine kinase
MANSGTEAGQQQPAERDARAEFLDIAGHELRGPITALRGQIQLMQRKIRSQPDRSDDLADLNKMMYQIERLNNQVDVFLAATHITQERFQLMRAPCDIVAPVRHVTDLFAAGVRDHALRFESDEETITGDWDRKRLEELTAILLTNAVKYSRGGDIVVRVRRGKHGARVEVGDRGPGVAPADRRRIFRAYETGGNIENRGAGLGLYVAGEIVRGHHGRLSVRARRGGGSTFWFEVPLSAAAARQRVTRSGRGGGGKKVGRPVRAARRKRPVATKV